MCRVVEDIREIVIGTCHPAEDDNDGDPQRRPAKKVDRCINGSLFELVAKVHAPYKIRCLLALMCTFDE